MKFDFYLKFTLAIVLALGGFGTTFLTNSTVSMTQTKTTAPVQSEQSLTVVSAEPGSVISLENDCGTDQHVFDFDINILLWQDCITFTGQVLAKASNSEVELVVTLAKNSAQVSVNSGPQFSSAPKYQKSNEFKWSAIMSGGKQSSQLIIHQNQTSDGEILLVLTQHFSKKFSAGDQLMRC